MKKEEFRIKMKKRGWSDDEINELEETDKKILPLPMEYLLQDKPQIRNYYVDDKGNIIDYENEQSAHTVST